MADFILAKRWEAKTRKSIYKGAQRDNKSVMLVYTSYSIYH
jgi:hypothetical protein